MSEEKVNVLKVDYGGGGIRTVEVDFPGNSKKSKSEVIVSTEEDQEDKKVASGRIVHRNKGIGRRFRDVFLGSEVKSIPDLLVEEVLVPQLKKTFSDMVRGVFDGLNNAVDLVLFGEGSNARRERRLGGVKIDYSRRSTERRRERDDRTRLRSRSHHNFDDILFDSRSEAIDVRDRLIELLYEYDFVTVNDFYEAADIEPVSITDSDYGWDNLSSAVVKTSRDGGYYISFPRPRRID